MEKPQLIFSREDMLRMNIESLKSRGVTVEDIALIAYHQQGKYTPGIQMETCIESVEKILSYRDTFHTLQLSIAIDICAERHQLEGPIQDIIYHDLGLFGVDEVLGLDLAGGYGAVGKTNFGDIDVNKIGIVDKINEEGKKLIHCHTFLDDIVGAIAAAASTRVAQIMLEDTVAKK